MSRSDVRAVSVHDSRRMAREQSLRYPSDYTLELLGACNERLYRVLDERLEEDRNWQQLAALSFARFLKRRTLETARASGCPDTGLCEPLRPGPLAGPARRCGCSDLALGGADPLPVDVLHQPFPATRALALLP